MILLQDAGDVEASGTEVALNEAQLNEVFKNTSVFTVKTALDDNASLMQQEEEENIWFEDEDDDEDEWFGQADEDFWDDFDEDGGKRKRSRGVAPRARGSNKSAVMAQEAPDEFGRFVTLKKKKYVDPTLPAYTRIPPKEALTISWATHITPWGSRVSAHLPESFCGTGPALDKDDTSGCVVKVDNVAKAALEKLDIGPFMGIVMDPPWVVEGEPTEGRVTPADLKDMKLSSKVFPKGIVFIWVHKPYIHEVVKIFLSWGMVYVENLAWVKQTVTNKLVKQSSPYFHVSHTTCLMFRKEGVIELRHQRNPDVLYDFVRHDKGWQQIEDKPDLLYYTVETLLPEANYNADTGRGMLLELWAHDAPRKGWTMVVEDRGANHDAVIA